MQVTTGVRTILSNPAVYDIFQSMMGADRIRRELVADYIRPASGMRLLDIGCGTSRIIDYLPEMDYHGFDLSQEYINEAVSRYARRGTFRCEKIEEATLQKEAPYDLVLAMGVFHHLDDDGALQLLKLSNSALMDGGRLVTIDPCYSHDQNLISRFLVSKDRGQNVRHFEMYKELALNFFEIVSGKVRHRSWIPYTHWIMECIK